MLNVSDIRILYLREIRSALRERNILVNTILLPVFMYPVLLWVLYTGMTFVIGQNEGFTSRIMLQGVTSEIKPFEALINRDDKIEIIDSTTPESDIRDGNLDLLVEIMPATDQLSGNFRIQLTYDNSKDRSSGAHRRITDILARYRSKYLEDQGVQLGLSQDGYQQFWIETKNVATERQMGQFILGLLVPLMLIVMVAMGAMYTAVDCTAGEREKSTWETMMTVATARSNIVIAKYLYVATMASMAGLLNFTAMLFSMKAVLAPILGDRVDSVSFSVPGFSVPLIMLITVLLALFVAAGMMILASFARTFKEGQSMVSPFYLAIIIPIMFLQIPGLEFTFTMAAIPVVNICMVFREAVAGVYHWPQIGMTVMVELVCIGLCLWLATTILRYEDIMTGSYEGNILKFIKDRLFGKKQQVGGTHE